MGYTHYFYRPAEMDALRFASAAEDCRKICEALPIAIAGPDGDEEPVFDGDEVCINGSTNAKAGGAYEPLRIERVHTGRPSRREDGLVLGSCKTNWLPYNLAVQCCLIVFKHHFGNDFKVSSDGKDEEWNEASNDVNAVLGYGLEFELDPQT